MKHSVGTRPFDLYVCIGMHSRNFSGWWWWFVCSVDMGKAMRHRHVVHGSDANAKRDEEVGE